MNRRNVATFALLAAVLTTAVLAAHWPALSAQALSFDDDYYVVDNRLVHHPSVASAWRFLSEVKAPSTVPGYYQPLSMISLMLDWTAGGRPRQLFAFHLTSLFLHMLNTILVAILLHRLFGDWLSAGIAALVFGVHPMAVEPMCWVGERKTLLAALFALVCMITYVDYVRRPGWMRYVIVLLLFVAALLSKPSAMPLPALLLLLDFWPLNRLLPAPRDPDGCYRPASSLAVRSNDADGSRFLGHVIWEKLPLFAVAAAGAIVTFVSQAATADVTMPGEREPGFVPLLICHDVVFYLSKLIWPVHMSAYYPFPRPFDLTQPAVWAGVVGTGFLLVLLGVSLRKTRAWVVGLLFFFVAIFPTLGIVGFYEIIAADRHVYLPIIGLLLPITHTLSRRSSSRAGRTWTARTLAASSLLFAAGYAIQSHRHARHWRNTESLFRYMLTVAPEAPALEVRLGVALIEDGRPAEAIGPLTRATNARPESAATRRHLARAMIDADMAADAVPHLERMLQFQPHSALGHTLLGVAFHRLGRVPEAVEHLEIALELKPGFRAAERALGDIRLNRLGIQDRDEKRQPDGLEPLRR